MPKSIQFFSQAVALLPETWQSPDTITNQFEHEGHKEYFVRTIVAYVSSLHDFCICGVLELSRETCLTCPPFPSIVSIPSLATSVPFLQISLEH